MVRKIAHLLQERKTKRMVRNLIRQLDNAEYLLEIGNEDELVTFITANVNVIELYGLSRKEIFDLMLEELNALEVE